VEPYEEIVKLENKARLAQEQRRYGEALAARREAIELAQTLQRPRLLAVLLNRLGELFETNGNIQQAVVAHESGLKALANEPSFKLDQALEGLESTGKTFNSGSFYDVNPLPDIYDDAIASDLATAENDPALPVRILLDIGNAYLSQPQERPALQAYQQALAYLATIDAPLLRGYVLANIGEIRRRDGALDSAVEALDEAVHLIDTHGEAHEKRRALALLAGIARDRKQFELAEQTYDQALKLYTEVGDQLGEGRTRAGLARLYLQQEQFDQARSAYERALELATAVHDDEPLWHIYWGLGRCQWASGDLEAAAESFKQSLEYIKGRQEELRTDEGKVSFLDSVQDVFDRLIGVYLDWAKQDSWFYVQALQTVEEAHGRALHDLMPARRRQHSSATRGVRASRATEMAQGTDSSDFSAMVAQQAIATPSPSWDSADAATDESDPQLPAITPKPLTRLVFHGLVACTAVFVVSPDGTVDGHVAAIGCEALDDLVAKLRQALGTYDPRGERTFTLGAKEFTSELPDTYQAVCQKLYNLLIADVAEYLPTDGTPVVIEPHASLWLLPFAALQTADGQWLADRWPLLYTPSEQVLNEIRSDVDYGEPSSLNALIVGNPVMPTVPTHDGLTITLNQLPGSEQEALAIANILAPRSTVLLGIHADRTTVMAAAQQNGILHLATHGVAYANNPLSSFVALAQGLDGNGLFTARDVMDLSLPADLVTLSACQSGLGHVSGDGMIGLSRAFLIAGARSVLVSQWSVDDQATALLMAEFYHHYLEQDNKAVALQLAMRVIRTMAAHPEYQHPRYWSPFVMVGAEA